jgi:hypothetical protein
LGLARLGALGALADLSEGGADLLNEVPSTINYEDLGLGGNFGGSSRHQVTTFYCETAGLAFDKVIDSNRMSQMNVFQKLGHPCIPFDYIRHGRPHSMVKYDKIE